MATRRKTAKRKPSSKKATKKKATRKKTATRKTATKKKSTKRAAKAEPPAPDNVVAIRRYTELSITQISLDTGITRKTVRKRLAEAHVEQARLEKGYPVYRLKDVLPALYTESEGTTDPDKLRPFERRAYYQGEKEKLSLAQERAELIVSFEMERAVGSTFKMITQHLETIPDNLERDAGIDGPALELVEQIIDGIRQAIFDEIAGMEDADSAIQVAD